METVFWIKEGLEYKIASKEKDMGQERCEFIQNCEFSRNHNFLNYLGITEFGCKPYCIGPEEQRIKLCPVYERKIKRKLK